jgi:hypothetical protein
MKAALENVLTAARASVSVEVHSLLDEGRLHVSLTHPLALRGELARTFATRVSALATQMRPFKLSLVSEQPKVYHNTAVPRRAFIAARVGAGRDGLETMLKPIRSLLAPHRVEAYFDKPEWHASFAWCLDEEPAATAEGEDNETEGEAEVDTSPFPSSLLGEVASVLESLSRRAWDVDTICVRVGPTVTRVDLPPGH